MNRPPLTAPTPEHPEILAPAGDEACFLAALAAGADNIYLGLKAFSARMQAENFSLTDLSRLTDLAHENGTRVTVAMNTLIKDA
ncbi:MAG: U32 family peptidase, partial [Desulfovibrionaceae bacterium]|nr:U32 family peptidase [Desulfovibrionaceae bacterium]